MLQAKKEALEITTKLVEAKLSNSGMTISAENGQAVGAYFAAIFEKVSEITEKVHAEKE